ncbi:hypothetical protein ACFWOB_13685 [Streptomyces sp. NPDC058420]|uniref:hypothetical protein n=1 Tax=Streptomyces sp. NPDC058420 TaxID=3346489 RepID=UPI00364A2656
MDDPLIVVTLLLAAASTTAAVAVRHPARQALVLAVLGTVPAVLLTVLQVPDVALSRLAVGSAVLLILSLAMGTMPGFATAVGHAVPGRAAPAPHWTLVGVLLGLASTLLALGLAALAVTRPKPLGDPSWTAPLRRLQSGHIGDYAVWLLMGTALLAALALPGVLNC